jgi:hypothetical protein
MKLYKAKEVHALTEVGRWELIHWVNKGFITPAENPPGRGKTRYYDFTNLVQIMVCRELARLKMESYMVSYAMKTLEGKLNDLETTITERPLMAIVKEPERKYSYTMRWYSREDVGTLFNFYNPLAIVIDLRSLVGQLGGLPKE